MTYLSVVISGLLVAVMIGIAAYGWATLPAGARVPLHHGFRSYDMFASKTVGLIMWPVIGLGVFALFAGLSAHAITTGHAGSSAPRLIIMPVLLAAAVAAELGAIAVARRSAGSRQDP